MKPKRIILVRHGESIGNSDPTHYETVQDYKIGLSELGKSHARLAGQQIKRIIGSEKVSSYISPWARTRETYEEIKNQLDDVVVRKVEDPRLREQEWGHLRNVEINKDIKQERKIYGTFYYRIPDVESGADVYDRISTFLDTFHRDSQKVNYPENKLIVTHGVTLRIFLMRWFHWTPEYYEKLRNPKNGQVIVMEQKESGYFQLTKELETR